jgi:hypothetical protein
MIDDFESTTAHWDSSTDAQGSTVECGPDTGGAYEGAGSLRIAYRVAPHGWVDCGRSFASPQDWSAGQGISMWLYADGTADWVTLMVFSGDPEAPTPFEVALAPSSESVGGWSQIGFSWTSFERAPWADEGGLAEVDPTRIVGYGFSLGADEDGGQGVLRVDAVHVSSGAAPPLVIPSATPTTGPAAPTEAPTEEPTSGPVETAPRRRGVCPGAAALPSLGLLGALILRRQRSADTTKSADPNNAT